MSKPIPREKVEAALVHEGETNEAIFSKIQFDPDIESLLPPMDPKEFDGLRRSIESIGVTTPICVNPQGVVLNGHNRVRACRELLSQNKLKTYPSFTIIKLPNKQAEMTHALEANLHSREMNKYLKIEAAARLIEFEKSASNLRMRAGKKSTLASNDARGGKTTELVAEKLGNVSVSTVERALYIMRNADDEMRVLLRKNKLSIGAAYRKLKSRSIQKSEASTLIENSLTYQSTSLASDVINTEEKSWYSCTVTWMGKASAVVDSQSTVCSDEITSVENIPVSVFGNVIFGVKSTSDQSTCKFAVFGRASPQGPYYLVSTLALLNFLPGEGGTGSMVTLPFYSFIIQASSTSKQRVSAEVMGIQKHSAS